MSVNKVILIGTVCVAPKYYQLKNGGELSSLFIATTSERLEEGLKEESAGKRTDWHKVVGVGDQALQLSGMKSGDIIYVEGRLKRVTWIGKDKRPKSSYEIISQRVTRLFPNEEVYEAGTEAELFSEITLEDTK